MEACDGAGGGGIGECRESGIQDMQRGTAEVGGDQLAQSMSIVDVEPLGGGYECTEVAIAGERHCLEEEVQVKSGKFAGLQAAARGGSDIPVLPVLFDVVVTDVGRVADEEGRAIRLWQTDVPVIGELDDKAVGETPDIGCRAEHERRDGVCFDGDEFGMREEGGRRGQKTAGAGSGVHDAGRLDILGYGPGHHRVDDIEGGVYGALAAARNARPNLAEGVAERIAGLGDLISQRRKN